MSMAANARVDTPTGTHGQGTVYTIDCISLHAAGMRTRPVENELVLRAVGCSQHVC